MNSSGHRPLTEFVRRNTKIDDSGPLNKKSLVLPRRHRPTIKTVYTSKRGKIHFLYYGGHQQHSEI